MATPPPPSAAPSSLSGDVSAVSLQLVRDGVSVHSVPVPLAGLTVGRAPENGLPLGDGSVSRSHAQLFWLDGQLWLRDLDTTNGTWINNVRVVGVQPLADRDLIRFGDRLLAKVQGPTGASEPDDAVSVVVEDEWTLVRQSLGPGTYGFDGKRRLVAGLQPAVVQVTELGVLQVRGADGVEAVAEGGRFTLGAHSLRVVPTASAAAVTRGTGASVFPYRLRATVDGRAPAAWMAEGDKDERRVCGGNGAVVLYLLARQLADDRARGLGDDRAGWADDDTLGRGVWGRGWTSHDPNGLHVLLYRLRRSLERAGFDPTCLEKLRGETRLRVAGVTMESV